jgi:branched-chain amino acid transport system ATP-binding protein
MTEPAVIRVRDLSKTFDHVRVLDHVSLEVSSADAIVALAGPNAAGKTTFFNILAGIERPDTEPRAVVEVLGHAVQTLQPWEVARLGVARLFQDARVFGGLTLLQNVHVAANGGMSSSWLNLFRRPRGDATSVEALGLVGLAHRRNEVANVLSLGDRRKLAIACMLRTGARLLLLDEPTANLDATTTDHMKDLVKMLARNNRHIVIIEHNREFVRDIANVVFTIHQGQCTRETVPAPSTSQVGGGHS